MILYSPGFSPAEIRRHEQDCGRGDGSRWVVRRITPADLDLLAMPVAQRLRRSALSCTGTFWQIRPVFGVIERRFA